NLACFAPWRESSLLIASFMSNSKCLHLRGATLAIPCEHNLCLRDNPSHGKTFRRPDAGENRGDRLRCWCRVISSKGLPKHRTEFLPESHPVLLRCDRPTQREIFHAPQWASR